MIPQQTKIHDREGREKRTGETLVGTVSTVGSTEVTKLRGVHARSNTGELVEHLQMKRNIR